MASGAGLRDLGVCRESTEKQKKSELSTIFGRRWSPKYVSIVNSPCISAGEGAVVQRCAAGAWTFPPPEPSNGMFADRSQANNFQQLLYLDPVFLT